MSTLSEQPPPRRGAKPGFYPDPLGSGRARWWDGSAWTPRVGGLVAADAPAGRPVPPPSKRCRHCGAESTTFEGSCPNCGRAYGTSTATVVAIVVAAVIAGILLLGGCAVLAGLAIEAADDEVDEAGVTKQEFDAIKLGTSEARVRDELGDPALEDSLTSPALDCLYYPQRGEGVLGIADIELCFREGILYSKSAD